MKQYLVKYLVVAAICFFAAYSADAQRMYVRVQPKAAIVARPAAPAPNYVWIKGEWVPRGGVYVYQPGYWIAPRPHSAWVPGHWVRMRRGWFWVRGYWTRA